MALLRPCATSAGFTATPDVPQRIDMGRLKEALRKAGFTIVVDARIILVVRSPAGPASSPLLESSLYDNGRVLLKTTDREAAEKGYAQIEPHLAVATV